MDTLPEFTLPKYDAAEIFLEVFLKILTYGHKYKSRGVKVRVQKPNFHPESNFSRKPAGLHNKHDSDGCKHAPMNACIYKCTHMHMQHA